MANNTGTFFNVNDNDGIPLVGVSTDGKVMINHLYGNCLIGSTSVTGTASQPLQVTGGAYVSGSVGIGTTSPAFSLDIVGDLRVTNSSGSTIIVNRTSNPGSVAWQHSGTETGQIQAVSGGGLNFFTGSTPSLKATLNNAGQLGIGTTNPTSKLHVVGGDIIVGIDTSQGIILTSQNGTKYRLIVSNAGILSTVLVP